jgi:hypothetical protein
LHPWTETSTEYDTPPATVLEGLRSAGLDFKVTNAGLYYWPDGQATINTALDSGHTALINSLGDVIDLDRKGKLLQNEEAFSLIDSLGYRIQAMGMMEGKTWVLARWISNDDQTVEYMILFVNDYTRVTAYMFGYDDVIINPKNIGIGDHFTDRGERLPEDVHQIVGSYFKALESLLDDLRQETVFASEVLRVLDRVLGMREGSRRDSAHLAVLCRLKDWAEEPPTKYQALRALYKYLDDDRGTRNDSDRFQRALFEPANPKQKILDLLREI